MKALRDLVSSEKGLFCLALLLAASVLTALGQMSLDEWQHYTKWLAGIYVTGKAIQGAAAAYASGRGSDLEELHARLDLQDDAIDTLLEQQEKGES